MRNIVVVLNDRDVADRLRRGGIDCVNAASRAEALQACARYSPHIVLVPFSVIRLGLDANELADAGAQRCIAVLEAPSAVNSLQAFHAGFDFCLYAPVVAADIERISSRMHVAWPTAGQLADFP